MEISESLKSLQRRLKGSRLLVTIAIIILSIGAAFALYMLPDSSSSRLTASAKPSTPIASFPITVPTMKWGFAIDTLNVYETVIESGQSLSDLLLKHGLSPDKLHQSVQNAEGVFDLRSLRAGNKYAVLSRDPIAGADYFVYEPSVYEYIVFDLNNDLTVTRHEKPVTVKSQTAVGTIESSLWQTMVNNGYSYELTDKMEDALQWSVDFHHLKKGDEFRLVFAEKSIHNKPVGVGDVHAAYYKTGSEEFYAIYYQSEDKAIRGYYDLEGRPMKAGFLKAPLKYSRISSYYNLNRLHPILKYRRPHYGTDYAAPYGTPILAVGDGTISQATFTRGNGNFVKIRHDGTYETQYLHMQKFAKGIRPGVHVKQGQVIGYVGSTGLATGPHVCFRFWKNGKQVNHLNLNLPPAKPLPASEMEKFTVLRDQYLAQLNQATLTTAEESTTEEDATHP